MPESELIKLKGVNYFIWAPKMNIKLSQLGLIEALEEETDFLVKIEDMVPDSAAITTAAMTNAIMISDKKIELLTRKRVMSRKACGFMVENMDMSIQFEHLTAKCAFTLWNTLKTKYASANGESQRQVQRDYNAIKFTNVPETITAFRLSVYAMNLCELKMLEHIQIGDFLRLLPPVWHSTVQALKMINAYSTVSITLEFCMEKVMSEYLNEPGLYKEQAHRANTARGGENKGGNAKRIVTCYYCQEKGHFASDCQKQKDGLPRTPRFPVENGGVNKDIQSYWFVDSCASAHMSPDRKFFIDYQPYSAEVTVADGTKLIVLGRGNVSVNSCVLGIRTSLLLKDVLHVPDLEDNLISVQYLDLDGFATTFQGMNCKITRNGRVFANGDPFQGVYRLRTNQRAFKSIVTSSDSNDLWHRRYGHTPLKKLMSDDPASTSDVTINKKLPIKSYCQVCIEGKSARKSFPIHDKKEEIYKPDELIVSDIAGPFDTPTINGEVYFLTFSDPISGYTTGYLLKHKSETYDRFIEFEASLCNRAGRTIRTFRSDGGTEFVNKKMRSFLIAKGIKFETSVRYTPQQNGVAERKNRTIMEKVRCLLRDANAPKNLWGEAFHCALWILNRLPPSFSKVTPFQIQFKQVPSLKLMRRFGCVGMVHVPTQLRKKLDLCALRMMFVGYDSEKKGWRMYCQNTGKITISRDVDFNELENYLPNSEEADVEDIERINQEQLKDTEYTPDVVEDGDIEEDLSTMLYTNDLVDDNLLDADWFAGETLSDVDGIFMSSEDENEEAIVLADMPLAAPVIDDNLNQREILLQNMARRVDDGVQLGPITRSNRKRKANKVRFEDDVHEPRTFSQYLNSPDKQKWTDAMKVEMAQLVSNHTWDLVPRSKDMKVIGNKWVWRVKKNADGSIEKLKARLVALGNTQTKGVDFGETFAPVLHFNSFRTLLAISAELGLTLSQSDVASAFLNADLDETIYMQQPRGVDVTDPDYVCKLKKSLYGLKQAPRLWNQTIHEVLIADGFQRLKTDPCLYFKKSGDIIHLVGLYVDDLIQATNSPSLISSLNSLLSSKFKMVHLGSPKKVLGMEINQDPISFAITLNLSRYINETVSEYLDSNLYSVYTPSEVALKILNASVDNPIFDLDRFRKVIGQLMYITSRTRPDIAYSVRLAAEHVNQPTQSAWNLVHRILRFLSTTNSQSITYTKSGLLNIEAFTDSDWGSCINTRRSVTGCLVFIGSNLVMWRSTKQRTVALASTEAEYMALSDGCKEVLWLSQFLQEVGLKNKDPIIIRVDNEGSMNLAEKQIILARSKHIDIRYHFIREKIEDGSIKLKQVSTSNNIADALTKGLTREKFEKHALEMGLRDPLSKAKC